MHDMGEVLALHKFTKSFVAVMALFIAQPIYADEYIDDSNCMQHLGGGGFGDFDCYEHHAKYLEADNKKVANSIKSTHGVKGESKAELDRYMRAQDEAAKACDLASKLAYDWNIEEPPKTHVDMYDVMGARCHYSIRKQQNDFLHDLYSIKTGE
ncbi:hypothetical protein SAMN06265784_10244 [Paraburkholderia susongensis]|uniref:Lysozyme inhibitor LprI N-terminal domain-containing protein n=2 Tax=Paraburkholderia susongensis TaxID=1515439 RepID=A0A1X7J043_9BURK|nr:hypothetical protein SAMN06265784_10244 [Paraburkholderia susongensis]